jgi:hypothetical protein
VVLAGSQEALRKAVATDISTRRYSGLIEKLRKIDT